MQNLSKTPFFLPPTKVLVFGIKLSSDVQSLIDFLL